MSNWSKASMSQLFSNKPPVPDLKHPLLLGFVADCSTLLPRPREVADGTNTGQGLHRTGGANKGADDIAGVMGQVMAESEAIVWKREGLITMENLKVKLLSLHQLYSLFTATPTVSTSYTSTAALCPTNIEDLWGGQVKKIIHMMDDLAHYIRQLNLDIVMDYKYVGWRGEFGNVMTTLLTLVNGSPAHGKLGLSGFIQAVIDEWSKTGFIVEYNIGVQSSCATAVNVLGTLLSLCRDPSVHESILAKRIERSISQTNGEYRPSASGKVMNPQQPKQQPKPYERPPERVMIRQRETTETQHWRRNEEVRRSKPEDGPRNVVARVRETQIQAINSTINHYKPNAFPNANPGIPPSMTIRVTNPTLPNRSFADYGTPEKFTNQSMTVGALLNATSASNPSSQRYISSTDQSELDHLNGISSSASHTSDSPRNNTATISPLATGTNSLLPNSPPKAAALSALLNALPTRTSSVESSPSSSGVDLLTGMRSSTSHTSASPRTPMITPLATGVSPSTIKIPTLPRPPMNEDAGIFISPPTLLLPGPRPLPSSPQHNRPPPSMPEPSPRITVAGPVMRSVPDTPMITPASPNQVLGRPMGMVSSAQTPSQGQMQTAAVATVSATSTPLPAQPMMG